MLLSSSRKKPFNKDAILLCLLPSIAVLLAMLGVSVWVWLTARQNHINDSRTVVKTQLTKMQTALADKLDSYEEILRGTAAMFETGRPVSRADMRGLINAYSIQSRYPGVRSIGYAPVVSDADRAAFTATIRDTDYPAYTLTPDGSRSMYIPVLFIEPQDEGNTTAIGFDMYSDTVRHDAFTQAGLKNQAIITGKINPRSGLNIQGTAFQMYVPVYESQCVATANDRSSCRVTGYVFASFRMNDLVKSVQNEVDQQSSFRIYDGTEAISDRMLYDGAGFQNDVESDKVVAPLYGRSWTIVAQVPPQQIEQQVRSRPALVLIAGIGLSISSSAFIYILLLQRVRSLRASKDQEVQMMKDDLLALAAHQLRTPATAVKQYIVMTLDGYGGKLSRNQKELVKKAYENNERQLRTVNEMLYVANADAGKLRLLPRSVDIVRLVREAIEEQADNIKTKRHELVVHLPSTPLHYDADELYLRMAVSNLISNAIKYTPDAGKIEVSLKVTPRNITISVKDNGVGISKKQMPELFKKFSRLDNPLSAHAMGNGLGLYLARRVIELHHGRIKVTSVHTVGSEFTIILPRLRSPDVLQHKKQSQKHNVKGDS